MSCRRPGRPYAGSATPLFDDRDRSRAQQTPRDDGACTRCRLHPGCYRRVRAHGQHRGCLGTRPRRREHAANERPAQRTRVADRPGHPARGHFPVARHAGTDAVPLRAGHDGPAAPPWPSAPAGAPDAAGPAAGAVAERPRTTRRAEQTSFATPAAPRDLRSTRPAKQTSVASPAARGQAAPSGHRRDPVSRHSAPGGASVSSQRDIDTDESTRRLPRRADCRETGVPLPQPHRALPSRR